MADGDSSRAFGPPDPLGQPPRSDVVPNENEPIGSVGPNVPQAGDASSQELAPGGYGSTHVLYDAEYPPLQAVAWAGWPAQWDTPNTASLAGGDLLARAGASSDIVWSAISRNAEAFADMPVIVEKAGVKLPPPTWLYNPQPEQYASWSAFARQAWWSFQTAGEIFLIATSRFADGYPRTFMLLDPWLVNAEIGADGLRHYAINGIDADDDVLHIMYHSWPGDARGHGPLEVGRERMLAARTLQRYATELAANGGIPWGVLKSKYRLTVEQANRLRAQWISSARSRSGAPAIVDGEVDLQLMQVTPRDMVLSDLQKFAESRLAVLLGVPPYLLGLPVESSSMTYQNVSQIFDYWWRIGLRPNGNHIMRAISAWALPYLTELSLNAIAYTQPTALERSQTYVNLFGIVDPATGQRAISIDEIREAEHLAPLGETAGAGIVTSSPQSAPQEVTSAVV